MNSLNTLITQRPLDELIGYVETWRIERNNMGSITFLVPYGDDREELNRKVTVREFIALDPRFAELLDVLSAGQKYTIDGFDVEMALIGWQRDLLSLPIDFIHKTHREKNQPGSFQVRFIEPHYTVAANGDVTLMANYGLPAYLPSGQAYCVTMVKENIRLTNEWLQQHCPAWSNKLSVALTMGMEAALIPKYVFDDVSVNPAPGPLLDSTNLDV